MNDRLTKEICAILKRDLKKSSVSYVQLAAELDISEVSVKRLLNGGQPLSMQRLVAISQVVGRSLSNLFKEAEENIHQIPLFSQEQDEAFVQYPPLFTFWSELAANLSVEDIGQKYQLTDASIHLYLRKLEQLELVELGLNNACKMTLPAHAAFEKGSRFSSFFTGQRLSNLQKRVLALKADEEDGFLISLCAELTSEEFQEINQKLEDWMFNKLRESQELSAREGLKVTPYTFGFMAAKGKYHEELPEIPNITSIP
ncbi:putative Helix-turn-helix XRE-family like protein [Vibrio nigripulchritudo SOn1]|uniref:Helix-turn-helix XRE-family like protein n=1 Tax=Vibrio nigripulchritudo SOn1 TaxID=1238450 RepID=A0AAV2VTA1_9VIBR|nr:helix-turn-helix transcriptional regulator [Vibrio nigripulchritudo]CCO47890.1 putative Helix-turn-helix XRE-family like protein [Vibrio nigripulchritudo SOn1]